MPIPLVVAKRVVNESHPSDEPTTNRNPNRDKTLARSNQSRTPEIYRRQEDIVGYKLQFPLSEVLSESKLQATEKDCLMCCPSNKVIKSD